LPDWARDSDNPPVTNTAIPSEAKRYRFIENLPQVVLFKMPQPPARKHSLF